MEGVLANHTARLVAAGASTTAKKNSAVVRMESVLSDPFGVTATQIMDYLLNSDEFDEKICQKLIKGKAKRNSKAIIESIKDYEIKPDQALKLTLATSHLDYLEKLISETQVELFVRTKPFENQIKLITELK